jgi:outer membrane protein TolC
MVICQSPKLKLSFFLLVMITFNPIYTIVHARDEVVIDLDQAIEMALHHEYQEKIARNNLEKAKLVVKEKFIDTLPKINLGAEKGENLSSGADLQNTSLTVTETIPTDLRLYGRKTASESEIAKWGLQASEADYRISRAQIVYDTISLYLNTVKAERKLVHQETAVVIATEKAEHAKVQLSLGKITKVDQLTAENDLAKARYELESNRQGYLGNLKRLAQKIGINDYRSLRLDQSVGTTEIDVTNYEELLAKALETRLELLKTRIAVKEAEQELAKTINRTLPALSLAYQNRSREESYNLEYDFLSGNFNWTAAWQQDYLDDLNYGGNDDVFGASKRQYKLKLSWSFGFGDLKNQIQQGTYTLENAKLAHLQSVEAISAEIDEALSGYELAVSKRTQAEQGLELYRKDLELTRLKSELGMATSFQVKDAELKLAAAKMEIDNALCDLRVAAEKLRLALGELYEYPSK